MHGTNIKIKKKTDNHCSNRNSTYKTPEPQTNHQQCHIKKPSKDTHNKILYMFNNDRALDTDVESNWKDITILFLIEIQPTQKSLLCPDGDIHCKINTSLLKTHLKRTAAVRSSCRAVERMIRVAGRASTDGTSTAHTVVDRANGIHSNLKCGTDQDVAPRLDYKLANCVSLNWVEQL